MRARLIALLSRRVTWWVVLAVALACAAPSLGSGFVADDDVFRVRLGLSDEIPCGQSVDPTGADLFRFTRTDLGSAQPAIDQGCFPWWSSPDAKLAFLRPLSGLTHKVDATLWPDAAWLWHAHSLAWFLALLLAVWAVYRRFLATTEGSATPWLPVLAFLLFAWDDAHGPTLGWIANRNALIAVALSLPALVFHDRARNDGGSRVLGPLAFGIGMLAGESAVSVAGYLIAYGLVFDTARDRWRALLPYGAILIVWLVAWKLLGFGPRDSGLYTDPAHPLEFARAVIVHAPVLLFGQLGVWSDLWVSLSPSDQRWFYGVAVFVLLCWASLLRPLWRDRTLRFFVVGLLIAVVPVCGAYPADRVLVAVGVGGMAVTARFFAFFLDERLRPAVDKVYLWTLARPTLVLTILGSVVLAPPSLALRARWMETVDHAMSYVERAVPKTPEVTRQTVVVVNAPSDLFVGYLLFARAARHQPGPAALRWLSATDERVEIERLDADTLRVQPASGFLSQAASFITFPNDRMVPDDIAIEGMHAHVVSRLDDDRPAIIDFTFAAPLDDARYHWLAFSQVGAIDWRPPAIGERVTVGPVSLTKLLFE